MEKELLKLDQIECPVIHRFGAGLYIREVFVPAGTFLIGHYQRYEHLNIFLQGRVLMFPNLDDEIEISAPMMFIGKPGRKCGLVLEDMVWVNIFLNPENEQDIEKLEEKYFDRSEIWKQRRKLLCQE